MSREIRKKQGFGKQSWWIPLVSILLFCCTGCFGPSKISNQNLYSMYVKEIDFLHPVARIYHLDDSISRVYYKINTGEMLFQRLTPEADFTASFVITANVLSSYDSKIILDSVSITISDLGSDAKGLEWIGHLDFKCAMPGTYLLELRVFDNNRRQGTQNYYEIDKTNEHTRQNWILFKNDTSSIYWDNILSSDDSFFVYRRKIPVKNVNVRYYRRSFPLALPPFSVVNPKPFDFSSDSIFVFLNSENGMNSIGGMNRLKGEGFYHFQSDTALRDGFTVFRFNNEYPKISDPKQLLGPIRYITTKQEYEELSENPNTKLAVDNFWIKLAGSPDRAREIIRKIYKRVIDANEYFASYQEGWKTDRGLIYLVYGSPNIVYKKPDLEIWIYGEENNFLSLSFTFIKMSNPFTNNDYIMSRSPIYKSAWYRAVDTWREGRVYSDN